jgi:hypothetical protein
MNLQSSWFPSSSGQFEYLYRQWLEWRDVLWVMLILIEESGTNHPHDGPQYTSCKEEIHDITHLTSRIGDWLEYMRDAADASADIFQDALYLEDLEKKRHHYYNDDHPVQLISTYLHRDIILVYLNSFPLVSNS